MLKTSSSQSCLRDLLSKRNQKQNTEPKLQSRQIILTRRSRGTLSIWVVQFGDKGINLGTIIGGKNKFYFGWDKKKMCG